MIYFGCNILAAFWITACFIKGMKEFIQGQAVRIRLN
jgi:hypothetical protein